MKVIPTHYKGYFFRSRLEARWAVFFDALHIKWEYETEGFEFDGGTRYLPDFWLPDFNLWVEVKGVMPEVDYTQLHQEDQSLNKLVSLRKATSAAALLIHDPLSAGYWLGYESSGESLFHPAQFFCYKGEGALAVIGDKEYANDLAFTTQVHTNGLFYGRAFNRALTAFRSARFEFGENA